MIALFLIFFSYVFYQMLVKPALSLDAQSTINHKTKVEAFFDQTENKYRNFKFAKRKSYTNPTQKPQGFQGGEYIDYEEL